MPDKDDEPTVADMIARAERGDRDAQAWADRMSTERQRLQGIVNDASQKGWEIVGKHNDEIARQRAAAQAAKDRRDRIVMWATIIGVLIMAATLVATL